MAHPARHVYWCDHRGAHGPLREDDRHAPARGDLQRCGWWRRVARIHHRVRAHQGHAPRDLRDARSPARRAHRYRVVRRFGHCLCETAGVDDRPSRDLPGPADPERRLWRRGARADHHDPGDELDRALVDPAGAGLHPGHRLRAAHRWCRRAGVDLTAQRVHRSRGRGLGLHARLEPADRRRVPWSARRVSCSPA
jgi:hypothetical protein